MLVLMDMLLFNYQNHKQWIKDYFPYNLPLLVINDNTTKEEKLCENERPHLLGCNARARTYANSNMQGYQMKRWRWSYLFLTI